MDLFRVFGGRPNPVMTPPRSGLSHEGHRRDVEQVYLRCSQGSLEWLYPTGAIVVNLRPNTAPARGAGLHACIKPSSYSQVDERTPHPRPQLGGTGSPNWVSSCAQGSRVYLEHAGGLALLLAEDEHARADVRCFGLDGAALFVEAAPAADISRRITALQYELVPRQGPGGHMYPYLDPALGEGGAPSLTIHV